MQATLFWACMSGRPKRLRRFAHAQNDQIWIGQSVIGTEPSTAHNGGNARWRAREGGDIACPVSAAG